MAFLGNLRAEDGDGQLSNLGHWQQLIFGFCGGLRRTIEESKIFLVLILKSRENEEHMFIE